MKLFDNWNDLYKMVNNCNYCELCKSRKNVVFGEGNLNARMMIIAEAPGYDEDSCGKPFVGKAGKLLDQVFDNIGIKREDIYITNIVKCHPDGNRNPIDKEIDACINYLRNQVVLIKPKVIVLLGSVALKTILGKEYFISKVRGKIISKNNILYVPTWHPSAVLRDPLKLDDFINDLELAFKQLKI